MVVRSSRFTKLSLLAVLAICANANALLGCSSADEDDGGGTSESMQTAAEPVTDATADPRYRSCLANAGIPELKTYEACINAPAQPCSSLTPLERQLECDTRCWEQSGCDADSLRKECMTSQHTCWVTTFPPTK